jgi:hypothetical protein
VLVPWTAFVMPKATGQGNAYKLSWGSVNMISSRIGRTDVGSSVHDAR